MIELYTAPTPNGHKVSCTLEALKMEYKAILVNLGEGDQKKPDFLKISPNGRIPAIIDKANKLISSDPIKRAKVNEWLMFQMGGVGPMMGQANVFFRYFPEKIQPAIDRYQNESRRLFEVLNTHLENNEWLAGDYSIADIANWCWVRTHKWSGVSTDGLNHLERWKNAMYEQPGMLKGIKVPIEINIDKELKDKDKTKEFIKNAQKMVKK